MSTLETFALTYQPEQMPPTAQEIDTFLQTSLAAQNQRPLQWAIVKSDPESKTLWLEGCCVRER